MSWNTCHGSVQGETFLILGAGDGGAALRACSLGKGTAVFFSPAWTCHVTCTMLGGDTRALSPDLRKALGGRDCDYPHPVDENAEERCDVLTWAGTQNYPRLSNLCLQLRHREGNRQGFRTGSRSRGARGRRAQIPGPAGTRPSGRPSARCLWRRLQRAALPDRPRERW